MYDERVMGSVVAEIFKECMHGVKTLATILSDEAKNRDIWGIAGQKYEESIARRHNSMKILGMTRPVPLDRIYTKVNLLEKISTSQIQPDADLREFSSIRPIRAGIVRDTRPGIEAVDENDKMMILGKPGSGKTTFLKHLALQAISGHLSNAYVPIFLSLHEVSTSNVKLREAIDQEFVVAGLRGPTEFVNNLLTRGKCLILFDGLDEVSEDRRKTVVQEMIALSEQFHLNKFVITCRVGIY
jgi:predicted NACHT family NTPase